MIQSKDWATHARRMERKTVTICIAAVCSETSAERESRIVLCADWKNSGALGSAETALKIRGIHDRWVLLTAGDSAEIQAIINGMRDAFREADDIDESNIKKIIGGVLSARKRERADELIRGQYAMSYDEFIKVGKDKLPDHLFADAMTSIRDMEMSAEFIVAGFHGPDFPLLIETDRYGRCLIREDFAVIGEGGYLAQSVMLHRKHSDIRTLPVTLYTVYEAKRYAEGAPSVGSWASFDVMHPDGHREDTSANGRVWLESQYAKFGPKKLDGIAFPDRAEVLETK